MFDRLYDFLSNKRYDECDKIFQSIDADVCNLTLLLALLKGTVKVKDSLPSREGVLEIMKQRIIKERPKHIAEQLLKRLR